MITLSNTSLGYLNGKATHEWLNKQMGIPVPDYPFLKEGKEAHRIIQDHVSGKLKSELLKHIEINFPIVEEESDESDMKKYWAGKEKCKFEFRISEKYSVMGFFDGLDNENGKFLEIKTSSSPWSMKQFRDAVQRKIYALARPDLKEAYLITGSKDPKKWEKELPKLYSLTLTEQDRKDALEWILKGIEVLESGKFRGGLDENGKCTGCFWNMARYQHLANCNFL